MPTGLRWLALASVLGGLLLIVAFSIQAARLAPDLGAPDVRQLAPPDASLTLLLNGLTFAFGALLGCGALALARAGGVGWAGWTGALFTFLAGILDAATAGLAMASPQTALPINPFVGAVLYGAGALLFGLDAIRARILPRAGAALIAFFCPTGLFGLAGPDALSIYLGTDFGLAPSTLLRLYGYLAMLAVGAGWAWLGYAAWRRRAPTGSQLQPA